MDVDVVSRPGIGTPFSPAAFDDLEMGGSAKNLIVLDEEKDREKSPPTKSVFERPILKSSNVNFNLEQE